MIEIICYHCRTHTADFHDVKIFDEINEEDLDIKVCSFCHEEHYKKK